MFSEKSLHDECGHICQVYSKLLIIGYIFNYHDLSITNYRPLARFQTINVKELKHHHTSCTILLSL